MAAEVANVVGEGLGRSGLEVDQERRTGSGRRVGTRFEGCKVDLEESNRKSFDQVGGGNREEGIHSFQVARSLDSLQLELES